MRKIISILFFQKRVIVIERKNYAEVERHIKNSFIDSFLDNFSQSDKQPYSPAYIRLVAERAAENILNTLKNNDEII